MGADPVAISTALLLEPPLRRFSIRKSAKDHGAGGRLVGPIQLGDKVAVVDDTTTTGSSFVESITVLQSRASMSCRLWSSSTAVTEPPPDVVPSSAYHSSQ